MLGKYHKDLTIFGEKGFESRLIALLNDLANHAEGIGDNFEIRYSTIMTKPEWNKYSASKEKIPYTTKVRSLKDRPFNEVFDYIVGLLKEVFPYYKELKNSKYKNELKNAISTLLDCAVNARYAEEIMRDADYYVGRTREHRDRGIVEITPFKLSKYEYAIEQYCKYNHKSSKVLKAKILKACQDNYFKLGELLQTCDIDKDLRKDLFEISKIMSQDHTLEFQEVKRGWEIWKTFREIGITTDEYLELIGLTKFSVVKKRLLQFMENTKAFQRLKGICQTGIPNKYNYMKGCSRYEHSIGVYILLNKLGASEEEQVAGLLHDISHTAFSHIIDWVLGNSAIEDYQDNRHLSVIEQDELANILKKYEYSPKHIADYHRYKLLDSDIPNLCADRIDYSVREFPKKLRSTCINGLSVINGEIIFTDITKAHLFATNFLKRQTEHWSGYESATRYVILSELLREAIKDTAIVLEDLLKTDRIVINKLIKTQNKKYLEILDMMKNKDLGFLEKSVTPSKKKFRYVDPKILVGKEIKKLSEIDKEFEMTIKQAKENNLIGTFHGVLKLSN